MVNLVTVSLDNLDNLSVDEFNHLYWKGKQIAMTSMLIFPTWVNSALGVTAVLTAIHVAFLILERFSWWSN